MSERPIDGREVNRAELAKISGVSLPTVDTWVSKGCPFVERGGKGREWSFDTAAVIEWRIQRAVADVVASYEDESGKITRDEADRRRAVAKMIVDEIEADEALKQVMSRHEAGAAVASFCQVLKSGLSNAAAKIAGRATTITSAPEIQEMAEREFNRTFESARAELENRWSGGTSSNDAGGPDQPAS